MFIKIFHEVKHPILLKQTDVKFHSFETNALTSSPLREVDHRLSTTHNLPVAIPILYE